MSHRTISYAALVFLLSFCSLESVGQAIVQKPVLLKNGTIRTYDNVAEWTAKQAKFPVQVLMQFSKIPGAEERTILKGHGVELLQYLPENTWIATVKSKPAASELQSLGVRFITELISDWKTGTALLQQLSSEDTEVEMTVSFNANMT
ncbi:MAG: hypothetical protein K8F30_14365, partial [Taibaiella sp.]|nr:hypothetical protein [Taibaiella sp.]